jgi:hypothetical protein
MRMVFTLTKKNPQFLNIKIYATEEKYKFSNKHRPTNWIMNNAIPINAIPIL